MNNEARAAQSARQEDFAPIALIDAEIARIDERLAELRCARRVIEGLLPAPLPSKAWAEPECVIDISRAPTLIKAIEQVDEKAEDELLAKVRAEAAKRGLSMSAASREIFGNPSQIYQLRARRDRDTSRARAWLDGSPPPTKPEPARQQLSRAQQIEQASRQPMVEKPQPSFEEQLGRVERGEVGIREHVPIRAADPERTFGGVTGEIL